MSAVRYFPIEDRPYRMTMGFQRLEPEDWIEIDRHLAGDLEEKHRLMRHRPQDVIAVAAGSADAQADLLETLTSHLPDRFPDIYRRRGDQMTIAPLGLAIDLGQHSALVAAASLVQEDLLLLVERDGVPTLVAGAVCFPTRWTLADKIGHPLGPIHRPVPGFAARLGAPVERFFQSIAPNRGIQRFNWSLTDDPALFQPKGHGRTAPDASLSVDNVGHRLWFRVERQTVRRLRRTGAAVFGVRIHNSLLSDVAAVPERAARLLQAVETMPPALQSYKSIGVFAAPLKAYLAVKAHQSAT